MPMRPCLVLCCLVAAACAPQGQPPLDAAAKAKYYLELVEKRAECETYRQQLTTPAASVAAVDEIYAGALRARCVNKDI